MDTLRLPAFALVALAATACATSTDLPALTQARQSYQAAATNPQVAANAPLELRRAEETLRQAETSANEGEDTGLVQHQAYLANQRVAIAQETAAMKEARDVVANAGDLRRQAILEGRTQELEQQLQAVQTERGLVATLGDVLFATGQAELTPGAGDSLDRLAQFLGDNPERQIRIEGYTDATGSDETNLRLSEERALAVRNALVQRGVDPNRLITQGMGESSPVAPNSTEAGRQANRRVEIVIQGGPGGMGTGTGAGSS
ncbi:MAG TPA: OmpA family protein [Azospirillaceae bacterium]|nr:OmpA family protein [Azospirillaceae bacterium]